MAPNTNSEKDSVLLPPETELNESLLRSDDSDSESVSSEQNNRVARARPEHHYRELTPEEHQKLLLTVENLINDTRNLDWSGVRWDMVFCLTVHHILAFWGLLLLITGQIRWQTFLFTAIAAYAGGLGITMGTHRLWTHKAFKAVLPVRFLLMLMNCLAFQESIYLWCRNHRVHHKWSDEDADFTNSNRGFFFAHMGWKMYRTHPEVIRRRKEVYVKDLLADPVVYYQHYYYYWISIPVSCVIPALIPMLMWNEDPWISVLSVCLRIAITFHVTWCINSVAHLYGYKPYDKMLLAFEHNILGPFALGEGWHNFHHAFPRDYRASEMDGWGVNFTTMVIKLLNKFNLTYNLQTVSDDHIDRRTARSGDPSLRPKKNKSTQDQKELFSRTRKSKSPQSRKSKSPQSRKSKSPQSRKSKSPGFRESNSPQSRMRKTA